MKKLKGINWKTFAIDHAEKIVLGMAGLFVVTILGMTSWGTYTRTPDEFTQKVSQGRAAFDSSQWPDDQRKEFLEQRNPGDKVAEIQSGIPGSSLYQPSTRFIWPINKRKERLREPRLYGVQSLYADSGRFLGELISEKALESSIAVKVDDSSGKTADGTDKPRVDGPRIDGPRNTIDGPRTPGAGSSLPGSVGHSAAPPPETPGARAVAGHGATPLNDGGAGAYAGSMDGYMGMGTQRQKRPGIEARGMWFTAICGVIPMKQQVDEYQKALALDTVQEAAMEVQYWDFELQRKTAVAGADPWAGEWEPVDLEFAVSLLKRMDFDADVIPDQYRDVVFTIPLPYRVTGNWDNAYSSDGERLLASHPMIRQLLSDKQREEEETRNRALIEAAKKTQQLKDTTKRGLSEIQHDTRNMRSQLGRNQAFATEYSSMYSMYSMPEGMSADPAAASTGMNYGMGPGAFGRMQVVATPELLLFRFLDFSVVPGNAYIYRVRLKLLNPLFGKDPGELADATSREEQNRFTAWSEISNVAPIYDDMQIYVAKVDERKGAELNAYQWLTETGSYVKGVLAGLHRGEKVAQTTREITKRNETTKEGGIEADVLRPSDMTYMTERIDYVTPNAVVDYSRNLLVNFDEFPDLGVSVRQNVVTQQKVVMTNRFGELMQADSILDAAGLERADALMKQQEEAFKDYRQPDPSMAQTGLEGLLNDGGMDPTMMPPKAGGRRGRRPSALKRGGMSGYDMMSGGMSMPGASGMSMPGSTYP